MSDKKDIEIPSFLNDNTEKKEERRPRRRTSQERAEKLALDFQRTKEQSLDDEVIHAKKSRKKVSKMSQVKKMGIAFGLGVGVTLGVIGVLNKDNITEIPEHWKEQQITNEYLSDLYDVIHDNAHHNSNGYWYDTAGIAQTFHNMIERGVRKKLLPMLLLMVLIMFMNWMKGILFFIAFLMLHLMNGQINMVMIV